MQETLVAGSYACLFEGRLACKGYMRTFARTIVAPFYVRGCAIDSKEDKHGSPLILLGALLPHKGISILGATDNSVVLVTPSKGSNNTVMLFENTLWLELLELARIMFHNVDLIVIWAKCKHWQIK